MSNGSLDKYLQVRKSRLSHSVLKKVVESNHLFAVFELTNQCTHIFPFKSLLVSNILCEDLSGIRSFIKFRNFLKVIIIVIEEFCIVFYFISFRIQSFSSSLFPR